MTLPFPNLSGPAAIAFSGGGDSTAMVHAFRYHPQITHAFIIDHALRDGSDKEVDSAAEFAGALGYEVRIDRWQHNGIHSAIQVRAREYRYAAMGRMCRQAGIKHLVTAHTANDQAETLLMRLDRGTGWRGLAGMPEEAYAPLWPALADVTLHRPWLGVSRSELRAYNRQHELKFIDDPSNENRDFARIRARQALSVDPYLREDLLNEQTKRRADLLVERAEFSDWLNEYAQISDQNYVVTQTVPPTEWLLHILTAVAGTGGPIDRARRHDLAKRMNTPGFKAATLAGAWVVRTPDGFVFTRDMVAVTGRGGQPALSPQEIPVGKTTLWDGRFLIEAKQEGLTVEPAAGHLEGLRQVPECKYVFQLPAPVRQTLPVYKKGRHWLGFGALETDFISARSTAARRLQAL